jgi:transcriptional regulator with XRE-family HTH domain
VAYGGRFRQVRQARKLSLREAARRIGVTEDGLGKIERNETGVALGTLERMAVVYECEPGELLLGENALKPLRDAMKGLPEEQRKRLVAGWLEQLEALEGDDAAPTEGS